MIIGQTGLVYIVIPFVQGKLRSEDCGSPFIPVFENVQECKPCIMAQWFEPKIIEYQKIVPVELFQPFQVGAFEPYLGQGFKKPVHVEVYYPETQHAGVSSQCTGDMAFSYSRGTGDKYIL